MSDREGDMKKEAEIDVMHLQAKECWQTTRS